MKVVLATLLLVVSIAAAPTSLGVAVAPRSDTAEASTSERFIVFGGFAEPSPSPGQDPDRPQKPGKADIEVGDAYVARSVKPVDGAGDRETVLPRPVRHGTVYQGVDKLSWDIDGYGLTWKRIDKSEDNYSYEHDDDAASVKGTPVKGPSHHKQNPGKHGTGAKAAVHPGSKGKEGAKPGTKSHGHKKGSKGKKGAKPAPKVYHDPDPNPPGMGFAPYSYASPWKRSFPGHDGRERGGGGRSDDVASTTIQPSDENWALEEVPAQPANRLNNFGWGTHCYSYAAAWRKRFERVRGRVRGADRYE